MESLHQTIAQYISKGYLILQKDVNVVKIKMDLNKLSQIKFILFALDVSEKIAKKVSHYKRDIFWYHLKKLVWLYQWKF